MRHYLAAHGELPEDSLVAMCPISIRTPDQVGGGGNMISGMRVVNTTIMNVPGPECRFTLPAQR
jgi:hypothetical protein